MSLRNTLLACLTLSTLTGCQGLAPYTPGRDISVVDYAEELILENAYPNRRQPYDIHTSPVHMLQSGALLSFASPIVIGQRLASLCTGTGGVLIPPSNGPAENTRSGFRSVTYGCKRVGKPDFAFNIINISSNTSKMAYNYNLFAYEAVDQQQKKFEDIAKQFYIQGF